MNNIRLCRIQPVASTSSLRRVGLALSGGGSRAIAFHLGCLRALHDRGILDQVEVLSTVSGGSVIGAMYAYGDGDFAHFESRVHSLLRRGLVVSILRDMVLSPGLILSMATAVSANVLAVSADMIRIATRAALRVIGIRDPVTIRWTEHIQPPIRRWYSRTLSFQDALNRKLFSDTVLGDVRVHTRHQHFNIVINATELRTGTAFRFGNSTTGSSRFGVVDDPRISVASAVAASAAYPAMLPAIDSRIFILAR